MSDIQLCLAISPQSKITLKSIWRNKNSTRLGGIHINGLSTSIRGFLDGKPETIDNLFWLFLPTGFSQMTDRVQHEHLKSLSKINCTFHYVTQFLRIRNDVQIIIILHSCPYCCHSGLVNCVTAKLLKP